MSIIWMTAMVSQNIKTHFKYMWFIICQLSLNETFFKKVLMVTKNFFN